MSNPDATGIYPCLIATDTVRQFDCCLWNGEWWARWTTMFDPPEWDPVEHQNCRVIAWVRPEHAVDQSVSHAAFDVLAERRRQVSVEGYHAQHDDDHACGEIANAAAYYALTDDMREFLKREHITASAIMPRDWAFKPKDRRRDLVRAGALILAEIERIDRGAFAGSGGVGLIECPECHGMCGYHQDRADPPDMEHYTVWVDCGKCKGTGTVAGSGDMP